ncbi:MAG: twin-arginine translocase TatA/TatE family subunit [Candidatus Omnitrophica bacterium]|nr:twin-arginine translocase TatA/TatE family subunit [Candidatus Omnitrophota bacterium]
MGNIGFGELLIVLAIILVLFGAKRLPEIGKALGDGIREFKKAVQGEKHEEKDEDKKGKK